jgi:hypothetical protein
MATSSERLLNNLIFLQARIFEGKEPPQFVALFQHMVVLKVFLLIVNTECLLLQENVLVIDIVTLTFRAV